MVLTRTEPKFSCQQAVTEMSKLPSVNSSTILLLERVAAFCYNTDPVSSLGCAVL